MSNYSLHGHIANWHLKEYLDLAHKNSWSMQIEAGWAAQSKGYSLVALYEAVQQGTKLTDLITITDNTVFQPLEKNTPGIPNFSLSALHKYLVKFVVADNQVSISSFSLPNISNNYITGHQHY